MKILKENVVKVTLKEAYDESIPDWIKDNWGFYMGRNSDRRWSSRKYNLGNAKFHEESVPGLGSFLTNYNDRINFFYTDDGKEGRRVFVYDPTDFANDYWTPDIKYLPNCRSNTSPYNAIFKAYPYFTKYAWIDISNKKDADDIRTNRKNARSGSTAIDREFGALYDRYNDISRDRDKSGYALDPMKYKRILASKNLGKFQGIFDDVYKYITNAKQLVWNFIDSANMTATSGDLGELEYNLTAAKTALQELENLFKLANKFNLLLQKIESGKKLDDDEINSLYRYKVNVERFYNNLKDFIENAQK